LGGMGGMGRGIHEFEDFAHALGVYFAQFRGYRAVLH